MIEKIFHEWFIIRETVKETWIRYRETKKVSIIYWMFFDPEAKYRINNGEWKKGNFYTMNRDFWNGARKGD